MSNTDISCYVLDHLLLLTHAVVTAATDYPIDVGWTLLQRGTQFEGPWWNVSQVPPPLTSQGEPAAYRAVLRKGDTLIFTATTKHAVTPNPTNVARRLVNKVREPRRLARWPPLLPR